MRLSTGIRCNYLSSRLSIAPVIAMDAMVDGSVVLSRSSDIMVPCLKHRILIKTNKLHAIITHNMLLLESMMSLESPIPLLQSRMAQSVFTFKPKEISYLTVEVFSMEFAGSTITQLLQSALETREE
jgi:hypothetical protein